MIIAQLSDPHVTTPGRRVGGIVDTAAAFARAIGRLMSIAPRPDMAFVTGDLVNSADPAEYETLRDLLAPLPIPWFLLPGNHDDRKSMRAAFPEQAALWKDPRYLHFSLAAEGLRVLCLDTLDPGCEAGMLDAPRLAWLQEELAKAPEAQSMIFMHHPPFDTGIAAMDAMKCVNGDAMAEIVARHPRIERVACGHVHRMIQTRWAGTAACVAPSCAHQIALELGGAREPALTLEPPGILLHYWQPGASVVTHLCPVDAFGGSRPFG